MASLFTSWLFGFDFSYFFKKGHVGPVCVCVCVKIDDILVGFYTNRKDPVNRVKKCQYKRKMACGHPCRSKALEKVRGHWIQGRSGRIGLRTNSAQGRWQRRL